jgi:hypothetical protein
MRTRITAHPLATSGQFLSQNDGYWQEWFVPAILPPLIFR